MKDLVARGWLDGAAAPLVLQALTGKSTPEEIAEIRRLLDNVEEDGHDPMDARRRHDPGAVRVAGDPHRRGRGARAARPAPAPSADRILSLIVGVWLAGVLLLLARLVVGWIRVRRLQAASLGSPVSRWGCVAERLAGELGVSGAIHVIDSAIVNTPVVIGWLRPVVLLPAAALANLTPGQVEAILAHEIAHVRRHDFLVNVLQAIAETLLFYHPAVWWISSRIRIEREHCCGAWQ